MDILAMPDFDFARVSDIETGLADLEIPKFLKEFVKALEPNIVELQNILKRNVIEFSKVGENPFIKDSNSLILL